ncbi:MAG TPA: glycosyltransferase family 4 protein [Blastocatellia bacterium]
MKVLQIVGDSKIGGATYLILKWCEFLIERGCEVHVLSTDRETIAELNKIPGVTVIDSIYIPRDIAPAADLRALARLSRFMSEQRYEVVHTHTSTPGFIGRAAAFLTGTPIRLHSAHGWPVSEFSSFAERLLYAPLENLAARMSSRVICVSHAARNQGCRFKLAPANKIVVVSNGIDPSPFITSGSASGEKLRGELGLPPECLLIGSTGRLAPQKAAETLIRSIPHLRTLLMDKPFVVLLAGDGPERADLESLSASLGADDCVRFLGFRRDVPELLSALDIFVTTSLWEGLSISLLEAMAAARPIVATEIEPNAELIEHKVTGLLVPVRSPEDTARAIARFAFDSELTRRCAGAARRRVLEQFTAERMFREQWNLYEELRREVGSYVQRSPFRLPFSRSRKLKFEV